MLMCCHAGIARHPFSADLGLRSGAANHGDSWLDPARLAEW